MTRETKAPECLTSTPFSYCPGCHHGIANILIAEVIDELGIREKTIAVFPVGCSVLAYKWFNLDSTVAAHGRAPEVAAGIKDVRPDNLVFTYQGDGDLAGIGLLEIIDVANRGENISVIFINNAIYGMTGGQMAPTTLVGQKTATSLDGRNQQRDGYPLRICELLATLEAPVYLVRTTVNSPKRVLQTKQAIKKAFELQLRGAGFSLVEILSACPVGWNMNPVDSLGFVEKSMILTFPLGVFRTPKEGTS